MRVTSMGGFAFVAAAILAVQAQAGADTMPTAAERAVLSACRAALTDAELVQTTRREFARQVRANPPLAFVDGYWVTPVNVTGLLQAPAVRAALADGASGAEELAGAERVLRREARLPRLVGLAFTAHGLGRSFGVPHANELEPPNVATPSAAGVFLVLLKDTDEVVIEYLPPPYIGSDSGDGECRFFCGDPNAWDFDDDGVPNAADDDDDGDGVEDARDAYPFWPGAASCDCGERRFTGFTEQFSPGITRTVLRARAWIEDPGRTLAIRGFADASGFADDLQLVFEADAPGDTVEFVMAREGGLCVTKRGGTLCRVVITVRDDGSWEAAGVLPPAPARGTVEIGAASRLAAMLDNGWDALTAHAFTGTCPSAYDGQELWYAVRRIPAGETADVADAAVRELRACVYDLEQPGARGVLEQVETLWRELGLPGFGE